MGWKRTAGRMAERLAEWYFERYDIRGRIRRWSYRQIRREGENTITVINQFLDRILRLFGLHQKKTRRPEE